MISAAEVHEPIDVVASRSWQFGGPLLDLNYAPLPLAGATIVWRLETLECQNVITLSLGSGITVVDQPSATILVDVSPAQTTPVQPGVYRDWLTVTLADGTVLDEWTGIIRVSPAPA